MSSYIVVSNNNFSLPPHLAAVAVIETIDGTVIITVPNQWDEVFENGLNVDDNVWYFQPTTTMRPLVATCGCKEEIVCHECGKCQFDCWCY